MDTKTICYCIVALLLGMLLANMLKDVCGCNVVEGYNSCKCIMNAATAEARDFTEEEIKSVTHLCESRDLGIDDYSSRDACMQDSPSHIPNICFYSGTTEAATEHGSNKCSDL